MIAGMDLSQILLFPVKDSAARKNFLIGCAIALVGLVVPVVPYLFIFGYTARIIRQVLASESPRMTAWDDWEKLFKDGAKMFGIRMIYSLPLWILLIPMIFLSGAIFLIAGNAGSSKIEALIPIFSLVMMLFFCLLMLLSLPLGLITPTAEMHMVTKGEFAAGFRFKEWWKILRANLGGFLIAFVIFYVVSMALGLVMQVLMMTIILTCLLPFFVPVLTMYSTLVLYTMMAQAYRVGAEKLAVAESTPVVVE